MRVAGVWSGHPLVGAACRALVCHASASCETHKFVRTRAHTHVDAQREGEAERGRGGKRADINERTLKGGGEVKDRRRRMNLTPTDARRDGSRPGGCMSRHESS